MAAGLSLAFRCCTGCPILRRRRRGAPQLDATDAPAGADQVGQVTSLARILRSVVICCWLGTARIVSACRRRSPGQGPAERRFGTGLAEENDAEPQRANGVHAADLDRLATHGDWASERRCRAGPGVGLPAAHLAERGTCWGEQLIGPGIGRRADGCPASRVVDLHEHRNKTPSVLPGGGGQWHHRPPGVDRGARPRVVEQPAVGVRRPPVPGPALRCWDTRAVRCVRWARRTGTGRRCAPRSRGARPRSGRDSR